MKAPIVRLYLRVRLDDGTRAYLDPVSAANGKLKPGYALHEGVAKHYPDSVYHLRYLNAGKRVWEAVGGDAQTAVLAKVRKEKALQAVAAGLVVEEHSHAGAKRRLLIACIGEYLAEIKDHREAKTYAAYRRSMLSFAEHRLGIAVGTSERLLDSSSTVAIEDLTRTDALAWIATLLRAGNEPRTLFNRANNLNTFMRHFGLTALLSKKDKPKFTQKTVRAYNQAELAKLFGSATEDEADLLYFLLCTGAREQDASFACWTDLDLEAKTYKVTEHLDLGYRPKDKEEGTLPLPDMLIRRMAFRRRRYPRTRLIFESVSGKPERHMLRIIKRLALRAGVNCCECVNKKGQSCIEHPVCKHVILHKMRKTFATTVHHNGMPARTVQRYLRHSDLTSTLRYIADQPEAQVRETINASFVVGGVQRVSPAA